MSESDMQEMNNSEESRGYEDSENINENAEGSSSEGDFSDNNLYSDNSVPEEPFSKNAESVSTPNPETEAPAPASPAASYEYSEDINRTPNAAYGGQFYQASGDPGQPQQNPYQRQPYQYQQPYQSSQGYYVPQSNEYVYAPQPPKKKKNVGKGILIAIAAILTVFVVSVGSIAIYSFVQFQQDDSDSLRSKVPIEEHQFTNKADDEDVDIPDDVELTDDDEDVDDDEDLDDREALSNAAHTQIRDFPTIEQLAAPDDAMKIPDIYDKVSPSVVGISAAVTGGTQLGTGFIISDDGYIITNAHVIEGYTSTVKVVDGDMNEYDAEVIGSDELSDIAVLRINPEDFDITPVEFGISGDLRIGELAIAIGNPLGFDLYGTMTTGIISGLDRNVTIEDNSMTLLQTSAAINSGNSGGPLIDAYGRVIGITSAKIDSMYGESLGFAIPIDEALPIVKNLIEYGYVLGRPSIGITGMDISRMQSLFYNVPQGIQVTYVEEGSGAAEAGIIPGDYIIGIQGETVTSMSELSAIKNQYSVGDTITLTVYRPERSEWGHTQGRSFDVEVVLSEASPEPQS